MKKEMVKWYRGAWKGAEIPECFRIQMMAVPLSILE